MLSATCPRPSPLPPARAAACRKAVRTGSGPTTFSAPPRPPPGNGAETGRKMQNIVSTLVTAVCGAMIAVAAVIVMTNAGLMPVNGDQIRTYLLTHPQLVAEMAQG